MHLDGDLLVLSFTGGSNSLSRAARERYNARITTHSAQKRRQEGKRQEGKRQEGKRRQALEEMRVRGDKP